ncbi:FMN-binding negative transcriptional regulator [Cohnella sp. WQ 127256]|uniref:FMN-binding negative transcriptional regulator n=1 Tax=Cohnella sp. WQ 127256 TaxID=2938790 RepID=UPI002119898E|nr:FMN-binding negative transcriptional regulator [Cohnella sp. WQ 127256]
MYIPKHFLVEDQKVIYEFIDKNSFGILFSTHDGKPFATHLPLLVNQKEGYLYGHFARSNSQWNDIEHQEVLVVFQGAHSYISPSWYETTASVPTWNYVAVHVYGRVELIEDKSQLLEDLNEMVSKYEESNDSYRIDESNTEFVNGLMKGIVGFKLTIHKLEGKRKLSQNHSIERQERVISNLELIQNDNAQEIAKLMKNNNRSK